MKAIHKGLPVRQFIRPDGVVNVTVSARSGRLPPADYTGRTVDEVFIAGTQPTQFDRLEEFERRQAPELVDRLRTSVNESSFSLDGEGFSLEDRLDLSLDTGGFSFSGDPLDTGSPAPSSTPSDLGNETGGNPLLD